MLSWDQQYGVAVARIACGSLTLVASTLFLFYVFGKTLFTSNMCKYVRRKFKAYSLETQKGENSNPNHGCTTNNAIQSDAEGKCFFSKYLSIRMATFLQISAFACALADVYSLGTVLDDSGTSALCITQAVQIQFFRTAITLWSLVISLWLLCSVVLCKKYSSKFEIGSHIFVWGGSTICTVLPAVGMNTYGKTYTPHGWCWINKQNHLGLIWTIVTHYLILWMSLPFIIIIYVILLRSIILSMRNNIFSLRHDLLNLSKRVQSIIKLSLLPVLFALIVLFPSFNFLYEIASGNSSYGLTILHTISFPFHGLLTSFIFIVNPISMYSNLNVVFYFCINGLSRISNFLALHCLKINKPQRQEQKQEQATNSFPEYTIKEIEQSWIDVPAASTPTQSCILYYKSNQMLVLQDEISEADTMVSKKPSDIANSNEKITVNTPK